MNDKQLIFICALLFYLYFDSKEKKTEETIIAKEIQINQTFIPADVLRDFPGKCFAVNHCKTFEVGESWDLKTKCGRSTCVQDELIKDKLFEKVETCEHLPPNKEKCVAGIDKSKIVVPYPHCCPNYICDRQLKEKENNEEEKRKRERIEL
ncbi:uncharacterized protein LOC119669273 [Teleopsis dalmanni]|uniref:uncharacterized protein LOC119669273 n=1 Tax=Teleopsis dalmanni TaxID=139649 RepID=UPI000D3299CF|nr:uncharacterized protein LOC119669273 [Teleopsis dalmanni]